MQKKLTSADSQTDAVATVHMIDVALLELTAQVPAPTATDSGLCRLKPSRVIVRVLEVVRHPRTWRAAVDGSPQETVLTKGMSKQNTPRLGAAEAQSSSLSASHGVFVQVASLEGVPRMTSVWEEGCGLMMVRERALDAT